MLEAGLPEARLRAHLLRHAVRTPVDCNESRVAVTEVLGLRCARHQHVQRQRAADRNKVRVTRVRVYSMVVHRFGIAVRVNRWECEELSET